VFEFLRNRGKREPGWLAISIQPDALHFAHGVANDKKNEIKRCGMRAVSGDKDLERAAKELGLDRHQCMALLSPTEYQLLLIDAPGVPAPELRDAARWRIKDMIDYSVDQATIDVLDIPVDPSGGGRGHSMYAVAANNTVIQTCMDRLARARVPVSVIDIPETAQRNIAAVCESPDRGIALLYAGKSQVLLTVNYRAELYLARRIDASLDELEKFAHGGSEDAKNRILLEVQRSFDHLERQFPFVAVEKLLVAPTPADTGLQSYLAENLDLPVEELRLEDVMAFSPDVEFGREVAWRFFHLFGATLRNGVKAS
jgi:MSHA biogenesis protein MshI